VSEGDQGAERGDLRTDRATRPGRSASALRSPRRGCTIVLQRFAWKRRLSKSIETSSTSSRSSSDPRSQAARELIVLELYRQGEVSSGRAAQLLSKEREEFIRYASERGIPYFQLDDDELQRELDTFKKL
jgi:predicted HTH domain antitoxin